MRKVFLTLAVAAAITLTACGSHATDSQADGTEGNDTTEAVMPAEVPATPGMARKLVEENTFIDIDYPALVNKINEAQFDTTKITPSLSDEVARGRAAIYRLAMHTKVVDSLMVYDGTPAKALNISEAILEVWTKSLDDNNATFRQWKEKGLDFEVPEFDSEYLESLLK